jgi:two-component system alkaline phosphatase synthesis response regulator PhoP
MALIYVVEDDKSIQEIEVFALSNVGYQVEGFGSARELYHALGRQMPDLLLLDVMLPDEDGLSVVRKLRSEENTASLPIMMVTAKTTELDKVKGLDMGADDYVTKPFGVMELISRVKAILRRSAKPEDKEKVLKLGNVVLDREKRAVYVNDVLCELTYKEYELLKLLMTNAGIVTARDVILNKVWGIDFEGESRTLDMHIKTLRQKLKEEGNMIKTVRNVGYIMNVDSSLRE